MQQDAGRLLDQVLLERRDLLGNIVVRRAREHGLAAHGLGGLLEALVHGDPIGVRRDHHVHDVGLARFALELALGLGGKNAGDRDAAGQHGECAGLVKLRHNVSSDHSRSRLPDSPGRATNPVLRIFLQRSHR
jgi:hypothetical protein